VTALNAERTAIHPLLAPSDPEDALTAYYALDHDPRRTQLTLHYTSGDDAYPERERRADGFVAVCQTGQDLFRPLVVIRAPNADVVGELLQRALISGRPYYLIAPLHLAETLARFLDMPEPVVNRIYRVDPARFHLTKTARVNVLVQEKQSPDGQLRWEIRSGGRVAAAAGTNWRSSCCAEIYVHTEPEFQRRGWGEAVVRAATAGVLREGLLPLYMVEDTNLPSIFLAEAAGYTDTGRREIAGKVRLRSV
jgi:GNAT superfamily N-acetyltransferase